LEKLLDISREMAENRLLDPLLEYAMTVALELCGAEKGYLVLVDDAGRLDLRVRKAISGETLSAPESQISQTILQQVISERQSRVIADASYDPSYRDADSVISFQLRSVMCAPLIARGRALGAIYVENRSIRGLFSEQDLKPLEYFAAQTAVSIENAMLNDELEARVAQRTDELKRTVAQLEQRTHELVNTNAHLANEITKRQRIQEELHILAITDSLTGIFNRRQFFILGEKAFELARRHGIDLSALMLDVDHFKEINDRYGHAVGDQALQEIVGFFRAHVRSADILGRYGGEEFAILLPDTNLEPAHQLADRLRQAVATTPIAIVGGELTITVSLGVAAYNSQRDHQIDDLVNRADQALYLAKRAGRNSVAVWSE
jgi:diguanylate cyclase (GGDEF)-like protein